MSCIMINSEYVVFYYKYINPKSMIVVWGLDTRGSNCFVGGVKRVYISLTLVI